MSRGARSLAILLVFCAATHGKCVPPDCCPVECKCLGNIVSCTDLQLIEAPTGLPPWTDELVLSSNNLAKLDSGALLNLTKLKKLDLSSNKLGDNFTLTLSNETQLKELRLSHNKLTAIPAGLSLKNLTHLYLSHNSITTIDGFALTNFPNLQLLELSFNKIENLVRGEISKPFFPSNKLTVLNLNANGIHTIQSGFFENLSLLEELRLNRNRLSTLKNVFADELKNLRLLELNRNELKVIQSMTFQHLENLRDLRIKRNKIANMQPAAFFHLHNLVHLQLDYNQLKGVAEGVFFDLRRLQKISMSHNRILSFDNQAWNSCPEINELDLSYNNLTTIERTMFKTLDKLAKLKLDHNMIKHISDGAFNNTPSLEILDLNYNEISYMVEDRSGAFLPLGQLTSLGLAHNQIKSVNKNAFTGLSRVTELDLTGNDITSIQDAAFQVMTNLRELKLNSSSLVCDCALQWLQEWLQTHVLNGKAKCDYPHWLRGMPVMDLHPSNFTCAEFPKPRIVEKPTSQLSIKGENALLTCRATSSSDAPLSFTWKHNNSEIKRGDTQVDTISTDRGITEASSKLYIYNVSHADAGKYQCMVSNTYGTTYSTKAKISVIVYPTFTTTPRDIRKNAGETVTLECSAQGEPAPQIAWQKDGGNDFPAARERRMHKMPTDDKLFIVDVKAADSGVYSCTAQNEAGLIMTNATLTIFEPPSFVKPMENKEIMAGGSIVLECMASGSPRPKLLWKKNGKPLMATERHFFTAEDQLLIIVNTITSDAGNYECEMSNSLGSVSSSSKLTINPAPNSLVNEDDILGLIIITVVCCAVGTSIVWVVIIYRTRQRLNAESSTNEQTPKDTTIVAVTDTQTHMYLDTSSQHSKDSGTGDSTNPSNDQLQLCLPEEIVSVAIANDDGDDETGEDPLLRYTNHERQVPQESDDHVT